jgi:hypothetical protein
MSWILGISEEKLKRTMDFLVNYARTLLDAFVLYSNLFIRSLEKKDNSSVESNGGIEVHASIENINAFSLYC